MAQKIEGSDPCEQFSGDDAMHKQSSVEESTLEDLETIISQVRRLKTQVFGILLSAIIFVANLSFHYLPLPVQ